MIKIAASIMCGQAMEYGEELDALKDAGVDLIHFDIMDGSYVPNMGMGLYMLEAMTQHSDIPFDVHIMAYEPSPYYERIAKAGAEYIAIHAEAVKLLSRDIRSIKELGVKVAVVLNPATPLSVLENVIQDLDMVVLMTVNPGFSGQKFIGNQYDKIARLKKMADEKNPGMLIEVDGNIGPATIPACVKAGADVMVCGTSAIFKGDRAKYKENTDATRKLCEDSLKGV